MPFGLKLGQQLITHKGYDCNLSRYDACIIINVEVYVDDILVKSKTGEGHPEALQRVLERSRKSQLKMNPKKCVFGLSSGK